MGGDLPAWLQPAPPLHGTRVGGAAVRGLAGDEGEGLRCMGLGVGG